MPIARETLSMFELGHKPSQVILVLFLHRKEQKSQSISVPTDRQTLSMHRYLPSQAFRCYVGTPLKHQPMIKQTVPESLDCQEKVDTTNSIVS